MKPLDLTVLDWHKLSEAGSSHGSLYKATQIVDGITVYYKMSLMIGKKIVEHEAVNEIIVSRLLYDLSLAVSKEHLNKIWEIIWTRYNYLLEKGYMHELVIKQTSLFG